MTTISPALFYCCEKINYVTIPSSVKAVYGDAFYRCKDLEDVYCYAPTVPSCEYAKGRGDDPFARADIQYATLHIPAQSIESYKTAKYWQDFKEIVAIPDYEVKKCATPTISYSGGRLSFTCPTEGAQFVSEITDKDIKKSTFVPPIAFTGISIENRQTDYTINAIDTLVLTPSERNITLRFAALDYSSENQILYAFRLGNGNEAWNYIGKDHSVTFLDLKPNTYKLQIRSTNNDGVWVDNIRTLTIIVTPTFWETRWAQLLYIMLLILSVWGILRTRRYIINLKRNQQELHEAYLTLLNTKESNGGDLHKLEKQPEKPVIKPEDEVFMQKAIKFIEEHISDSNINIGAMAEATATSRSGLHRKMKMLLTIILIVNGAMERKQIALDINMELKLYAQTMCFLYLFLV